jgi:hypothetical protein
MANYRDATKERFWRRMLRSWERSGLSIREFCSGHDLAEHNFHAWRRELARRNAEVGLNRPERALFVPVVVQPEPASDRPAAIEVVFGNGRRLRIIPGFDAATLAQVVAVLEGRPC